MHATDSTETLLQRNISGLDPDGADGKRPEMQLCLQRFKKKNFNAPLCRSPITEGVEDPVAGDELHCLPGGSRIYGKWAANIHNGTTR